MVEGTFGTYRGRLGDTYQTLESYDMQRKVINAMGTVMPM